MYRSQTIRLFGIAALVGLALAACTDDDGSSGLDVTVRDTGKATDVDTGPETGPADTGDAAEDTGDVGETDGDADTKVDVIRRVVDRGLFGDMPPKNYFFDPQFLSPGSWLPLKVQNGEPVDYVDAYRAAFARTPRSAPVLHIPPDASADKLQVFGRVALRQQPIRVSIWLGRPRDPVQREEVALLTVRADDPDSVKTAHLTIDDSTERRVDGIYWTRFSKTLTGFFGPGRIRIEAGSEQALYVHAPVAVDAETSPGALGTVEPTDLEEVSELDKRSMEMVDRWRRRHRPDRPHPMRLPSLPFFAPESPSQ